MFICHISWLLNLNNWYEFHTVIPCYSAPAGWKLTRWWQTADWRRTQTKNTEIETKTLRIVQFTNENKYYTHRCSKILFSNIINCYTGVCLMSRRKVNKQYKHNTTTLRTLVQFYRCTTIVENWPHQTKKKRWIIAYVTSSANFFIRSLGCID